MRMFDPARCFGIEVPDLPIMHHIARERRNTSALTNLTYTAPANNFRRGAVFLNLRWLVGFCLLKFFLLLAF